MSPTVHVVGAGLAGLAAALDLLERGRRVVLHEATGKAGGRCRSFEDAALGRRIDNGNHLILSGNRAVMDHAARIGAGDRLRVLDAAFPFADLASGARWTVLVPASPLRAASALPPGAGMWEAARDLAGLALAGRDRTLAEAVRGRGAMWRGFWEPLGVAVLNAAPEAGSARLLRATLLETFARGAGACRPVVAPEGLGAALVEPAVAALEAGGAELRWRSVLGGVAAEGGRATALALSGGRAALGPGDGVVLAVPPGDLLPGVTSPRPGAAILNAHFVVPEPVEAPPILGLLGAEAQWVFARGDVLSVTISAAERSPVWAMEREAALALLWSEVARALGLGAMQPVASRLLRERGATCDQAPGAPRPPTRTPLENVVLAGDWTDTGLPATLEGAVRSGRAAAAALP